MRFRLFALVVAALATGVALHAEDKKPDHKCPLEKIMCPFHGDCSGECRSICDKGGEGLQAIHVKVAAAIKAETKKDADAHIVGTCKEENCKACAELNDKVFGPALKDRVNARFKEMDKTVKHTIKDANGKDKEVVCTFLTGKLCDACVDEMTKAALASLKALREAKEKTK